MSEGPDWLKGSFRLLMGGDGWWSRWWVPEAGNGQQSSQADALHLGDPAVMGLGFTVESQFLRDLKMTK